MQTVRPRRQGIGRTCRTRARNPEQALSPIEDASRATGSQVVHHHRAKCSERARVGSCNRAGGIYVPLNACRRCPLKLVKLLKGGNRNSEAFRNNWISSSLTPLARETTGHRSGI